MRNRPIHYLCPLLLVLAGGIYLGRGLAQSAGLAVPVFYAGVLEEEGAAVEGVRGLTLRLYDAQEAASPLCESVTSEIAIKQGRFRHQLSRDCVEALRGGERWVEAEFRDADETKHTLPRAQIGAVPYALEALHAGNAEAAEAARAGGELDRRLGALEAAIPSGALIAFDLDACPPGWSSFAPAAGRSLIGVNSGANGLAARERGQTLGEETHKLSVAELPSHTHTGVTLAGNAMQHDVVGVVGTASNGAAATGYGFTSDVVRKTDATWPLRDHTHNFTTAATGSGTPFNNMQPSVVVLYCRKD